MGAGHGPAEGLYVPGHSRVHHLPAECKLVALVLFVFAVVATPKEAFWAFGAFAAVLAAVALAAQVGLRLVARRLVIEVPFLAFAVFLPLVGHGERVDVLGVSLSVAGLWGAWNILAKATLGVAASILLAATTTIPEILHGLERLRLPRAFTSIASFMVRYMDVILGEMRRMRVARESRGYDARWLWQAKAVAQSAGALFIRSYERGERVYLAMLSRGYSGAMPLVRVAPATAAQWRTALSLPAVGAAVTVAAWTVGR